MKATIVEFIMDLEAIHCEVSTANNNQLNVWHTYTYAHAY